LGGAEGLLGWGLVWRQFNARAMRFAGECATPHSHPASQSAATYTFGLIISCDVNAAGARVAGAGTIGPIP
jgi:hypothetical protein